MEILRWVSRALGMVMKGIGCVGMGWDGYEGLWVGEGVLELK